MPLLVSDGVTASSRETTPEGYLVVNGTLARAGTLVYSAAELGLTDRPHYEHVNVYRSPDELKRAAPTFENKPITYAHPPEGVNARNWRKCAVGDARGVSVANDMMTGTLRIYDAQAITGIERGTKQLSIGFQYDLAPLPLGHSSGCAFEQQSLAGNHIAIVPSGRCGSSCAVGDEAIHPEGEHTMRVAIDGLPFELPDAAAIAIERQQAELERLRATDRQFARELATYSRVATFANDCGCQVNEGLNTHQLRVEVLKRLASTDAGIADMIRAGCQGRDLESASVETVAALFEAAAVTRRNTQRVANSFDMPRVSRALADVPAFTPPGSPTGLTGRDLWVFNLENAWRTPAPDSLT